MKLFKFLSGLFLILIFSSSAIIAQEAADKKPITRPQTTVEARAQRQTDNFAKKVTLDEKQAEAVKGVYLKYGKIIEELKKNTDHADRSAKMMLTMRDQENELRRVLTEEQLTAYKEYKTKAAEKFTKKKGAAQIKPLSSEQRAQSKTDRLVRSLELTREQVPLVQKIYQEYYSQTDNIKVDPENRDTAKTERKSARETMMAGLKKVLTEEQYNKMIEKQQPRS